MPAASPSVITRGAPLPFVDALGNFFSLGNKLLFLNPRFESHHLDPELEQAVAAFIARHGIEGLQVRLNEYAPLDDLRRLFVSGRVNLLLRLFFGLPMWLAVHREIRNSARIRAVFDFLAQALPAALHAPTGAR